MNNMCLWKYTYIYIYGLVVPKEGHGWTDKEEYCSDLLFFSYYRAFIQCAPSSSSDTPHGKVAPRNTSQGLEGPGI